MNTNIKDNIENNLALLKGQPLVDIGRSGNLLWLGFGKRIKVRYNNGKTALKNYYSLDIQCSWRITFADKIVIADKDIYLPKDGIYIEDFDWDVYGANLFDKKAEKFKKNFDSGMRIADIQADNMGGAKLSFDTGHDFEIFPNDSLNEEYWRLIIFDNPSKHFVVFDN